METATSKRYFDADAMGRGGGGGYEAHIDVGTQADIRPPPPDMNASYSDDEYSSQSRSRVVSGLWDSGRRYLSRVTSTRSTGGQQHYSRQDFMEQYCVTPHQLKTLDKIANAVNNHQGGGLFGCLSNNQQGSVCSRSSLLSLCVGRQSNAAEDMVQYWPQKPLRATDLPPAPPPPSQQAGRGGRGRYQWVPEQAEEAYHSLERPRPIPLAGFSNQEFARPGDCGGNRLIGQGNMKITEDQIRQAQARMRGFNHTEPNTPMSSRRGHAMEMDDSRRGSKHVSFMEHRSGLVRSQTTSSFEESSAHMGPAARWRMAAARSQERLLDGPMIKPKKQPCYVAHQEDGPKPNKTVIMEKLKRAAMKTQATQTDLPLPPVVQKPAAQREKRHHQHKHHHHHHHQHGYLSLSPRSMHKSTQAQRTRIMKSYSTSAAGSTTAHSQASDISCISGSTSGWEHMQDSVDDDDDHEQDEQAFKDRPIMQRSQSAQPSTRNKVHGKRDLSPRYKEIFIDFEPNPNQVSPQPSPKSKRPLHKTLSEGEILLERRRIQHSDYIERQCESSATVEDAELYGRHYDPTSPESSPVIQHAKKSSEGTDGTNGSLFSSSSLLDEEEFHENILIREGLICKRRLSLDGHSAARSDASEFSDEKADEGERRPHSQPASVIISPGLLLLPDNSKQGGSSCDSLSVSGYAGSQQNTWRESQATVVGVNNSDPETMGSMSEMSTCSNQKRSILLISQQKITLETEFDEEDENQKPPPDRKTPSPQPKSASPYSNKASPYQSPSMLRPSPGCLDVSETSEDYVTATDNSGATDSSSRKNKPDGEHEPSGTSSSNLGEGESSFESASSMHSKDELPIAPGEELVGGDSTPTLRPDLIECSTKAPAETASPSSPSAESSSSQGSYSLHGSSTADLDKDHSSPSRSEKKTKAKVDVHAVDLKAQILSSQPAQWGDEERTKAKKGFKLDLPATPSPSKGDAPVTKPPRRKHHKHAADQPEVTTPGMVRSPAMHQGFKMEDWIVQRSSPSTSLPTPSSNIPPSERISPQTISKAISPGSRRLQVKRTGSSSSSSDEEVVRRTPSPSARSPTTCKTLPRSPRRRPARSPTATLQRPRRKSISEEMKGTSSSQTALPSVTYTASSVRRKSAPKINQPPSPIKGPDGKIVPPENLLSPHPHHKFHSLDRKLGTNKASPTHAVKTALSAESLRSVSPGSDSVFYDPHLSAGSPSTVIGSNKSPKPSPQAPEAPANGDAYIVQPPAGFGDSPEGPKKPGGRLFKKLEKRRFKSEERGACTHQHKEGSTSSHPRRHQHRACKHATARAKSEERRGEKSDNNKVASSRSANSSLELLRAAGSSPNMQAENPDEIGVIYGSFRNAFWLYISPQDEKLVWKKPLPVTPIDSPPNSPEGSTSSERDFRRRYQAVTHRMVHRRASAEMFERLAARTFETEQTVTVRKGDGEFGFRIHGSRPVVVSAIEPSTPAESSGLEVGDIVISVNGVNVLDASHSEVVKIAHAAGRVRVILGSEVLQLEVARTRHLISPDDGDYDESTGCVERCGRLMKKTPTAGHWVHRWLVLRSDGCLYYYKTPSLESRPLGAILVSQYTVSAPDPSTLSDTESGDPVWLIRLLKDGCLAMTLGADSQAERDQWLSSLYTAATTPIKWEDRLVNRGTLSLNPSDIINPDCYGFLNKLGRRWRNWNRLYCVLKDACLFLFPTPDSPRASGLLCLHGYRVQNASAGGKRFAFDLLAPESKQKHFYFHTDSELDKKRWMAALEYSIDRWLKIA